MDLTGRYSRRLDLACEPSAVHFARSHVQDLLSRWEVPDDVFHDAVTVVTELASNAVKYAGRPAVPFEPEQGQPSAIARCAVSLGMTNTRLHVGMWDECAKPPILRPISLDAEGGRGLQVVAGLAEGHWGHAPTTSPVGKIVWAALPLPADYRRRLAQIGSLSQRFLEAVGA